MSPLLAQSGHRLLHCICPLLGVKRTSPRKCLLLTQSGHEVSACSADPIVTGPASEYFATTAGKPVTACGALASTPNRKHYNSGTATNSRRAPRMSRNNPAGVCVRRRTTVSQCAQRNTAPIAVPYTRIAPTAATAPQPSQVISAAVISGANN
jgi:hypothetical protein